MKKFLALFLTLISVFTAVFFVGGCRESEDQVEYFITFDLDGGQMDQGTKLTVFGQPIGTLPVPEKEGFKFSHWLYTETNEVITQDTIWYFRQDITLKAIYVDGKNYLISTDIGDGARYIGDIKNPIEYNALSEDIMLINPIKVGYKFAGWSGTGIDDIEKSVVIKKGSVGDRFYTANWEEASPYIVQINLKCFVGNTAVSCTYNNNNHAENHTIKYNDSITVEEIDVSDIDYEYVGLTFVGADNKVRFITADTVFNEENFGENRNVVISVCCKKKN